MAELPDELEATELLRRLDELTEQQKTIETLRRKLIVAKCQHCQRFAIVLKNNSQTSWHDPESAVLRSGLPARLEG